MNSQKYSEVMISVRKIVRAINLESKRVEKNLGISIPQLLTLKHLNEQPDYKSTMRRLRDFLSLNASTVTGIVARLDFQTQRISDRHQLYLPLKAMNLSKSRTNHYTSEYQKTLIEFLTKNT